MEQLELRWHGHACFSVRNKDFIVVFDPYENHYIPGLEPLDLEADLVLCTHGHGDHGAAHLIRARSGHENPFTIRTIETYHDPEQGALRGRNTIYILECGDLRIAHFGDIGCTLTPAQMAELKGLDAAMIPVGGFYTIGPEEAKQLIDELQANVVIPMHYRMGTVGLPAIADLSDFLELCGDYVYYPSDTITINAGTQPQLAVLSYRPGSK